MFKTKGQQHCGGCGQCIDRRFAVMASKVDQNDPSYDYERDVFVGRRKRDDHIRMAVNYVRFAREMLSWDEFKIQSRHGSDLIAAGRHLLPNCSQAVQEFLKMYKRHADGVISVLQAQIETHSMDLASATLPETSLLRMNGDDPVIQAPHEDAGRHSTKENEPLTLEEINNLLNEDVNWTPKYKNVKSLQTALNDRGLKSGVKGRGNRGRFTLHEVKEALKRKANKAVKQAKKNSHATLAVQKKN